MFLCHVFLIPFIFPPYIPVWIYLNFKKQDTGLLLLNVQESFLLFCKIVRSVVAIFIFLHVLCSGQC